MTASQVRWAVVGVGDVAVKRVLPAIAAQPQSVLHACVTRDPERKLAAMGPVRPPKVYTQFEEMLRDDAVNAVYLATPVFLHAPQAIAAIEAGKDVLVEKPFALTGAEAAAVVDAARRGGRRLAVAYYRRFWPHFLRVKDVLETGSLGQIVSVQLTLRSWYPGMAEPRPWRVVGPRSGGGVLADVGSHRLDLLAWWFGLPEQVVARAETLTHNYDVEDSASLLMVLPCGAHATASFHWNSKVWGDEIRITGTEAQVVLNPCDGGTVEMSGAKRPADRSADRPLSPKPENTHFPMIDDFARSICEARAPRFEGEDGMKANWILDAVVQSSRTRSWVKLG